MKTFLMFAGAIVLGASLAHAGGLGDATQSASTTTPVVNMALVSDLNGPPATSFPTDVPKLMAGVVSSSGTSKGDQLRGVWIAEDVPTVTPPEEKIAESSFAAEEDNFSSGVFSFTPTNAMPPGKYRFELYVNDALVTTMKFTITPKE